MGETAPGVTGLMGLIAVGPEVVTAAGPPGVAGLIAVMGGVAALEPGRIGAGGGVTGAAGTAGLPKTKGTGVAGLTAGGGGGTEALPLGATTAVLDGDGTAGFRRGGATVPFGGGGREAEDGSEGLGWGRFMDGATAGRGGGAMDVVLLFGAVGSMTPVAEDEPG
jgi:hypothetical protein